MENETMMQADETEVIDVDQENLVDQDDFVSDEPVEDGSDSSPESGDTEIENKQEDVSFTDDQQKVIQKVIDAKVAKQRQAEREAQELRQKMEELQAKIPQETRPTVPEMPDPFDDNYEQKVAERDNALREVVAYEARQQFYQEQEQFRQAEIRKAQVAELQKTVVNYSDRAKKLGLTPEQLQLAGQKVAEYGVSEEVTRHILADDQGPLITDYLSKNPLEVEKLGQMTPMQSGAYLESVIKHKAMATRKPSNAPAPADTVRGKGTPPKVSPLIAGGSFS